jgi:hypothetical protein
MPNSNHFEGATILGLKEMDSSKTWALKLVEPVVPEKYAWADRKPTTFTNNRKAINVKFFFNLFCMFNFWQN